MVGACFSYILDMLTIGVEKLAVVEYPSAAQTEGMHWALSIDGAILKFKHESVMSTAKAIYDGWSGALNSTTPDKGEVFSRTCDLLSFGLVKIEFTRGAARYFVAAVDAWATDPRRTG